MFANTITLTINAVAKILQRVNQDNFGSEYSFVDGTESIVMKIRHSTDAADGDGLVLKRHNVFVEHIIFPTVSTLMKKATYTSTFRIDRFGVPSQGSDLGKAVNVWIASGTIAAELVAGVN
jgi:hypothetical protein